MKYLQKPKKRKKEKKKKQTKCLQHYLARSSAKIHNSRVLHTYLKKMTENKLGDFDLSFP